MFPKALSLLSSQKTASTAEHKLYPNHLQAQWNLPLCLFLYIRSFHDILSTPVTCNFSSKRGEIMQQLVKNLSIHPMLCVTLSVLIFLFSFLANYLLLDSLLKMHRSKSAVQKIKKNYTFLQRMRLIHFKENCRHAVRFCNAMILYQTIGWLCLVLYLVVSLLFVLGLSSSTFIAWFTVGIFLLFDIPAFTINRLLARPIIWGRFKAYSFEKYHNTDNHESLL